MISLNIKKHLSILGLQVEDRVTGFQGVVTSVAFDLYGCIQATVNPGLDKDGKQGEQFWFDVSRLVVMVDRPVMDVPNFEFGSVAEGMQGPAEKPKSGKV